MDADINDQDRCENARRAVGPVAARTAHLSERFQFGLAEPRLHRSDIGGRSVSDLERQMVLLVGCRGCCSGRVLVEQCSISSIPCSSQREWVYARQFAVAFHLQPKLCFELSLGNDELLLTALHRGVNFVPSPVERIPGNNGGHVT